MPTEMNPTCHVLHQNLRHFERCVQELQRRGVDDEDRVAANASHALKTLEEPWYAAISSNKSI